MKALKKARDPKERILDIENERIMVLPYIQGTTDKVAKIRRKRKIRISFSPPNSLRNMLDKAKDPIDPKHKKGVYVIPCSCGKVYINETGRSVQVRLKEHCADIFHGLSKTSAIAEHSQDTNHHICIEDAKIIATEDHYNKRRIREAIEIEKHPQNLNRDDGLALCNSWKPLIQILRKSENS